MDKDKEKYHEYLLSPEWKEFRKKAFEHYGKKCAHCKRTKRLQIHHKTYINIFNEKLEDVMILCELHHARIHGIKLGKPIKKKKRKKSKIEKAKNFKPKKQRQYKKVKGNHQAKVHHPNLDLVLENKRRREMMRVAKINILPDVSQDVSFVTFVHGEENANIQT